MAERNNAKDRAYAVLRQYNLFNLSLDDIVHIIDNLGYSIIDYSDFRADRNTETLIQELGLESISRNSKSFVYKNGDVKLVFICDSMSENEKRYAFAHELGHIICGHLKNGQCGVNADMEEEHEANEFAHYLLHPNWIMKINLSLRRHMLITIAVLIAIFCTLISIPLFNQIRLTKSYYGDYYITERGEKYHLKDCAIIKDKANIHRLTITEFESGNYSPCRVCIPE